MAIGTVKWFSESKGFGFIAPNEGGGKDVFVHSSDLKKSGMTSLDEGDKITYDVAAGGKGPRAVNLAWCDDATSNQS